MPRFAPFLFALSLCASPALLAAPVAFLQSWNPNQRVSDSSGLQQRVDLRAWARQTLGTDRVQVLSGRLRLAFSDDADALVDRGLQGYDGQTRTHSAYRGVRDGRAGLITERVITDWQTRGLENEAEQARVVGNGLEATAASSSRQWSEDGIVRETSRQWSGWTCYWWGCSGTETVQREGERHRITAYDGDFSLDLALGETALTDLGADGRWDFSVGAGFGDFLWRHARLDLLVQALPPASAVPAPGALALALTGLGLLLTGRRSPRRTPAVG